jgi:predicted acyltransferase
MGIFINLEKYRIIPEPSSIGARVASIDALRGFDMFWIMGGGIIFNSLDPIFHSPVTQFISTQLDHVEWLGFRFYDIIMPLFVMLAGISMPFAMSRRLGKNNSKSALWPHIFKRFILLWIIGMAVQGNLLTYDLEQFKFYSNTLQSIAIGYLIASVFILYINVRGQILATIGLLFTYWIAMAVIPVPGAGAGLYTPHENLALFIDKAILGKFQDGTTYSWILSSLNFGATVMLGVFAGYILKSGAAGKRKVLLLLGMGIGFILLGRLWHPVHPIIKHIWTGSFVLFSGGISYLLMAVFYLVIDVWKFQKWSKMFIIIGTNSIIAYTGWHLFNFGYVADIFTNGLKALTGNWYELIQSTLAFFVAFMILRHMYRYKIFIKV